MKTSFIAFWRRNLALANLGIVTNLEYRFNFIIDAFIQPILTVGIEVLLWLAIFKTAPEGKIGGFSREAYLAYAVWAPFLGRITISWMYESMMAEEVASGTINTILSRPVSFFEYYLSQMLGYKLITTIFSLMVPVVASIYFDLPIQLSRLPLALLLIMYYLILVHMMSFLVSTLGFYITRVRSFTILKNLTLLLLSGELVPIDLMPKFLAKLFLLLPFSSGVYVPLAYISGRREIDLMISGYTTITWSIFILGGLCILCWQRGVRQYTGTGA
ncbi:MAG: ABC transporter permease [Bdellovibrionaceae bacterium]|nr:ABC transporter permease [Bdellovibrio sp.]